MTEHVHENTAFLSLGDTLPDGRARAQTWQICPCMLPKLRHRLGPPLKESIATPEAVTHVADAIVAAPGMTWVSP